MSFNPSKWFSPSHKYVSLSKLSYTRFWHFWESHLLFFLIFFRCCHYFLIFLHSYLRAIRYKCCICVSDFCVFSTLLAYFNFCRAFWFENLLILRKTPNFWRMDQIFSAFFPSEVANLLLYTAKNIAFFVSNSNK